MSIIAKFVENNRNVTVREILFHVEEELEIGWARDTMKLETSHLEEIAKDRRVTYAQLMDAKERLQNAREPFEEQADEAILAETKKKATKETRERWVNKQMQNDASCREIQAEIESRTMDLATIDLRKTMLESDVKRAKYNFSLYEKMVDAVRLMVEHKNATLN